MKSGRFSYDPEWIIEGDAVVSPMTQAWKVPDQRGTHFDGGAYNQNLEPLEISRHFGGNSVNEPGVPFTDNMRELAGLSLYAGHLRGHFGNFLVDCLGRLWAVDEVDRQIDNLVYVYFNAQAKNSEKSYNERISQLSKKQLIRSFVDIFVGKSVDVHVVGYPVRCKELIAGRQLVINGGVNHIGGHAKYRAHISRRIDRIAGDIEMGAYDVYVSRSELPEMLSSFLNEKYIDELFLGEGYRVIHPQKMTIEEQFKVYRGARRIVLAEGSALHMYALASIPSHRVAILARRSPLPAKFPRQLLDWGVEQVKVIDAVCGYILPDVEKRAMTSTAINTAPAAIDFLLLCQLLKEAGFISHSISGPSAHENELEISRFVEFREKRSGGTPHKYVPIEMER